MQSPERLKENLIVFNNVKNKIATIILHFIQEWWHISGLKIATMNLICPYAFKILFSRKVCLSVCVFKKILKTTGLIEQ